MALIDDGFGACIPDVGRAVISDTSELRVHRLDLASAPATAQPPHTSTTRPNANNNPSQSIPPINCTPTGTPSTMPAGTLNAGNPVTLLIAVNAPSG